VIITARQCSPRSGRYRGGGAVVVEAPGETGAVAADETAPASGVSGAVVALVVRSGVGDGEDAPLGSVGALPLVGAVGLVGLVGLVGDVGVVGVVGVVVGVVVAVVVVTSGLRCCTSVRGAQV
jgi:hypothetical protein